MMYDLLFREVLYPRSPNYSEWASADVAVSDGVYATIGAELRGNAQFEVSGRRLVLLPGLFNMHTHSYDMFWRGAKDSISVDETRPDWYGSMLASMSIDEIAAGAAASYLANAYCGVTFVMDQLRSGLRSEPFARALARIGLRGRIHGDCEDHPDATIALPHETHPHFEAAIDRASAAPHRPVMIHAQETLRRLDCAYARFGGSTVELLDSRGLLHAQTFLVHLGHYSEGDLELIRKRGANIVATPAAEMKLGEPTFDPIVARERGISLLIGTDGPAYDASEDLFVEMKTLSLLSSMKHGPGSLPPGEILKMATLDAANAVATRSSLPALGAAADFVLIDAHDIGVAPIVREPFDNVAAQLVHGVTRNAVAFVCARGALVIKDGRPALVDAEQVSRAFLAAARAHMIIH